MGIAYTTVTDEEIPIQVNADLVHYRIERYLDGQFLERRQYESLDELIQNELAELDFDQLTSVDQDYFNGKYPPDIEPYIFCEWSESPVFEDGKRYGIREFDTLMKQADEEQVAGAKAALEKYGTWQVWYESDDPENARFLGYDKVKFTVVMPDGTTYTERQDIGDGDGGVLDFLAQYPKYQDILPLLQQSTPPQNDYMLLSRLKADCDYFLGAGGRAEKHLWAGNVREQIAKMRELYDALPEKPEWLTMEDIDRYAQRMEPPYEVVVYHHFENGFDERLDYQTLAEAEQAAQKYVAGTMEARMALPMMARVSMTFRRTDGCGFTGTSLMNEPLSRQNKPLPQRNRQPAQSRPIYSLKKKKHSHCRRSTPAVSALLSQPCTRRSPGISAMISTSPMTPWATAPPARNTRPMLPPSAP